ncbi:hypothetical protein B7494_g6485 [Chlorociboria aeruginascens]|nr:hypothetical protein B7494_g6485 [Chlorociboria aeruginascens]
MESPNEVVGAKRKRSPENPTPRAHQIQAPVRDVTQINYLVRARAERLRLIEGDSETFVDVLGMIDDYEGVLQRHESLAANLGAKLVGPLLLKSFEKLFDGPIKIIQKSFGQSFGVEESAISWLDVVAFARSNPSEFVLSDSTNGGKCCRFWIKGGQIEISEDDYRLILSGGPERMIPSLPIAEDESAELGTLNILESRLAMLIKKADAVASKARQLNYHLKGRKSAVLARKAPDQVSDSGSETRTFSPQPFSAVNRIRSPAAINNEAAAKLQRDLLDQFHATERRPAASQHRVKNIRLNHVEGYQGYPNMIEPEHRRVSSIESIEEGTEGHHRMLMAVRIEKLSRGDVIEPPCDRCRRLRFECTKHLTACSACTKKHAKCTWRDMTKSELEDLQNTAPQGGNIRGENGFPSTESDREPSSAGGAPGRPREHSREMELTDEEFRAALQGATSSDNRRLESMSHERTLLSRIASAAATASENREREMT